MRIPNDRIDSGSPITSRMIQSPTTARVLSIVLDEDDIPTAILLSKRKNVTKKNHMGKHCDLKK